MSVGAPVFLKFQIRRETLCGLYFDDLPALWPWEIYLKSPKFSSFSEKWASVIVPSLYNSYGERRSKIIECTFSHGCSSSKWIFCFGVYLTHRAVKEILPFWWPLAFLVVPKVLLWGDLKRPKANSRLIYSQPGSKQTPEPSQCSGNEQANVNKFMQMETFWSLKKIGS